MPYSKRLKGLELLRGFGLPTPALRVVTGIEEIGALELTEQKYGWTIRTCRTDGERETGGFFANHCSLANVKEILDDRLQRFSPNEFYIVYPSWKFYFSCNIVNNGDAYQIEGKYGSQKWISMGTEIPDYSVRASSLSPSSYDYMIGQRSTEVD